MLVHERAAYLHSALLITSCSGIQHHLNHCGDDSGRDTGESSLPVDQFGAVLAEGGDDRLAVIFPHPGEQLGAAARTKTSIVASST